LPKNIFPIHTLTSAAEAGTDKEALDRSGEPLRHPNQVQQPFSALYCSRR
jgi:hypothetical protein